MAKPHYQSSERSQLLAEALVRIAPVGRAGFTTLCESTGAHLFGVILHLRSDRARAEGLLKDGYINIGCAAQGFDADARRALSAQNERLKG